MTYLAIVSSILKLMVTLATIFEQQKWVEAGVAQATRDAVEAANAKLAKAAEARRAVLDRIDAGGLRDHDSHERPD